MRAPGGPAFQRPRAAVLVAALCAWAVSATPPAAAEGGGAEEGEEFQGYRPVAIAYEHLDGTPFRSPRGVYYDPWFDEIFVADSGHGRIAIFDRQGVPKFSFTPGRSSDSPASVTTDPDGNIYVLNAGESRIAVFDYRGRPLREILLDAPGGTRVQAAAMARGPDGNLYVLDGEGGRILVTSLEGALVRVIGGTGGPRLRAPFDLAFDAEGNLYVSDRRGTPVQVYNPLGKYLRGWGKREMGSENFSIPAGIAVDAAGRVVVADASRQDVKVFDRQGRFLGNFGGFGDEPGQVAYPTGVAAAPDGRICVLERVGLRLQIFEPNHSTPVGIHAQDADSRPPRSKNRP